jgi:hypothetical protein
MLRLMDEVDCQWSLSNPGPDKLVLWLEPWAEEFEVPVRSTIALSTSIGTGEAMLGEVEWTADHLIFWATETGILKVFVGGALQDSASALVPLPAGLTKPMLNILFAGQPAARLGGKSFDVPHRESWWKRARRQFLRL